MTNTEKFLVNAQQIHGNKYDYSLVKYVDIKTPVSIICSTHGEFSQVPNSHISKKAGCPQCSKKHYMTKELFVERSVAIHGDAYCYTDTIYESFKKKLSIKCTTHQIIFSMTPQSHILQKQGCYVCGENKVKQHGKDNIIPTNQLIIQAKQVHGDRYDYSLAQTSGVNKKVKIICRIHGIFFQRPNSHIQGKQNCPKCIKDEKKLGLHVSKGGYNEQLFETYPELKNNPARLYVIIMRSEDGREEFVKVGITQRQLNRRFRNTYNGVKFKRFVLHEREMTLYDAFQLEQKMLSQLSPHRYYCNYFEGGSTECFKKNIDTLSTIFNYLSVPNNYDVGKAVVGGV